MSARVNLVLAETTAKGNAPARFNFIRTEAVAKGTAPVRQAYAAMESAAKGNAPLRIAYLAIESLVLVGSPPTVSTEKFPLSSGLAWSVHVAPKFKTRVKSAPPPELSMY